MKLKLFHGSNSLFDHFKIIENSEAIQKEGPGVYLTNDYDDAWGYGKYIYEIEWNFNERSLISSKEISNSSVFYKRIPYFKKLIKSAPDYKSTLQNWDENINIGMIKAIESFCEHSISWVDLYQNIWIDFYRYSGREFCEAMTLYDGFIIERSSDIKHIIAFHSENIKIISVKDKTLA